MRDLTTNELANVAGGFADLSDADVAAANAAVASIAATACCFGGVAMSDGETITVTITGQAIPNPTNTPGFADAVVTAALGAALGTSAGLVALDFFSAAAGIAVVVTVPSAVAVAIPVVFAVAAVTVAWTLANHARGDGESGGRAAHNFAY